MGTTMPSQFVISPSITTIDNDAFQSAVLPAGFKIPSTVTSIDATAFAEAIIPAGYHWEKYGQIVSGVSDGGHEYKIVAD